MSTYTRRELIGRAIVAGAGATFVGTLDTIPAIASAEGMPALDPDFLAGQLLTVKSNGSLIVSDYDGRRRRALVGGSSSVWKSGDWSADVLTPGDCLYASGSFGADGVFGIDKVWVAIQTFFASVREVTGAGLTVLGPAGAMETDIAPATAFVDEHGSSARGLPVGALRPGEDIQIVGFHARNGGFVASRLIKTNPNPSPSPAELQPTIGAPQMVSTPDGPLTLCPFTWHGLASFFCCGNVSGCGYTCAPSNDGWCGGLSACANHCRSDGHYAAWKSLYCGSTTIDASCGNCCDNTLSQVPCGQVMSVSNSCSGKNDTVTIVDNGPNIHCIAAYGCESRTAIKFDLTPCAYVAIGGDLAAGHTTCAATIYLAC